MPDKTLTYIQLAQDTARQITSNYRSWTAYLSTASRLYKYQYSDQLLIHAQRPDATACAEYDLWNNTMRRYVRRGSKGPPNMVDERFALERVLFLKRGRYAVLPVKVAT